MSKLSKLCSDPRLWVLALAACGAKARPPEPTPPPTAGSPVLALELCESTPLETSLASDLPDADQVWIQMIHSAKQSLDFAEFYASNGTVTNGIAAPDNKLEPVIRAIEAALQRGVRVRFLADASFVKTYPDTLARLRKAGATERDIDLSPGVHHAKYFVVDGGFEAFFGSQNFDYRALAHNLELGVHVRDRTVGDGLETIFEADWARADHQPAPTTSAPASRLVASPKDLLPPGVAWDLPALIALVDGAKTRVRLQALTYRAGDWTELEDALVRAAKRGVKVELLVSDWAKAAKTVGGLQQLARTPNIAVAFITIPEYSGGFIPFARVAHAKLLVADGEHGWIGTGNFERDYFYASRNVGVRVDGVFANQADAFFERTWKSPYAVAVDPDASYVAPTTH